MAAILLFSAHPDDVDFGMGGTYLLLCKKYSVAHVILTRGEAGTFGTPAQREAEARQAASLAGATVEFLDMLDNHVEDNVENAKRLASIIRAHKPSIVFAPHHTSIGAHTEGKSHPDHTALGRLALKACRFAKFRNADVAGEAHNVSRLVFYMVPAYQKPSFIIDVSSVADELAALWSCYNSQHETFNGTVLDRLLLERRYLGSQNSCALAEGFIVESPIRAKPDWLLDI